jgi:hypothetical protein
MNGNLPNGNQPLVLADGRVVLPSGVVVPSVAAQATGEEPPTELAAAAVVPPPGMASIPRRKLDDLPDQPRTMNAINVVIGYALFGLDDEATCEATKLTQQQLDKLRASDAYEDMRTIIIRGVLDAEAQSVRDLFQQNARRAVGVLVDGLAAGSRTDRLAAARDLLDRAGHRPADVIEHRHRVDGGLIIEVVRKDERENIPVIEMEVV